LNLKIIYKFLLILVNLLKKITVWLYVAALYLAQASSKVCNISIVKSPFVIRFWCYFIIILVKKQTVKIGGYYANKKQSTFSNILKQKDSDHPGG